MDRDEVVKGLEKVRGLCCMLKPPRHEVDVVEAAIALLQPPTTAEIEVVRAWLCSHDWVGFTGDGKPVTVFLEKALDALAREPGLEARLEASQKANRANVEGALKAMAEDHSRIAALEAQLARVQPVVDAALAWHKTPLGWGGDDGMQRDALSVICVACDALAVDVPAIKDVIMQRPLMRRFNGGMPDPDKE
jgi:hypothetical protein